jgi:hypothetical protein
VAFLKIDRRESRKECNHILYKNRYYYLFLILGFDSLSVIVEEQEHEIFKGVGIQSNESREDKYRSRSWLGKTTFFFRLEIDYSMEMMQILFITNCKNFSIAILYFREQYKSGEVKWQFLFLEENETKTVEGSWGELKRFPHELVDKDEGRRKILSSLSVINLKQVVIGSNVKIFLCIQLRARKRTTFTWT